MDRPSHLSCRSFIGFLWIRFIVDWVQVFARPWSPAVPCWWASRASTPSPTRRSWPCAASIPPLRIGSIALDLSFLIVMVGAFLLLSVVRTIFSL